MRTLFTFAGGNGHFQPLVPIARAAADAGHRVAFAGQASMVSAIEAAGFTAFATGGATLRDRAKRLPLLDLDPAREDRDLRDGFVRRLARSRAADLLPLCHEWQPDLIVCDEVDFGAMVVAERLGIPHASVLVIAAGSFIRPQVVGEALSELRAEHGLPPDPELEMLHRYLVLSPVPPSYRDPAHPLPPTAYSLRPATAAQLKEPAMDVALPPWLMQDSDIPLVYFTLGTVFNVESGDLFERVLAGLGQMPVRVLATVGRSLDPAIFAPQPDHVHIERYIPQALLLPHCAAVVSHGGSGSVLGALAHGVPMVLLPMGADQPHNAQRCAALGVARTLEPVAATPESVRAAVADVLADGIYRRNAGRIRDEIAALPEAERAVLLLERLAAEREPIRAPIDE